ncbi:MAG TPA: mycothiol synthase [Propionibacteriaceae bacterium]|nr:mycothiol synthase [Propionibacteriaceae bacterium]
MTDRPTTDRTTTVSAEQAGQVASLVAEAAAFDGFAALNEAAVLALRHHDPLTVHAMAYRGTELAGYGQVLNTDHASTGVLVVRPSRRRQGIGGGLLTTLRDEARHPLQLWAMHDTESARRLADRHGLLPSRSLLVMSRSMAEPVPEPALPAGTSIRTFRVGQDEQEWLELNARAFASHPEQGSLRATDLVERMAEPWFDPAGFFLAERAGRMVGFHWTKQHPGKRGEVYVLGVDPDAGGAGLGTALLRTGLRSLAARGSTEVLLYVEADHSRAVALYTANGFTIASRDVMYAEPVPAAATARLRFKPTHMQEN